MKLAMDERLKHRLVGLAVLASIGVMVIPTMLKKTNHPAFDNMSRVAIHLPAKPSAPKVVEMNEARLFQKVTVETVPVREAPAVVAVTENMQAMSLQAPPVIANKPMQLVSILPVLPEMPAFVEPAMAPLPEIALAPPPVQRPVEPIHRPEPIKRPVPPRVSAQQQAKVQHTAVVAHTQIAMKKHEVAVGVVKPAWGGESPVVAQRPVTRELTRAGYAVQVAHFSNLDNATHLIHELQSNGFQAHYQSVHGKRGVGYTVLVGASDKKEEVMHLQQQLHQRLQLKGFVVPTSVS